MDVTSPESVAHRLIERDLQVRESGQIPYWGAVDRIVGYVSTHKLLADEIVSDWLLTIAATADWWLTRRLIESVCSYLDHGEAARAHVLFRRVIGLDEAGRWKTVGSTIARTSGTVTSEIGKILNRTCVTLENPDTWGATLCELLGRVLNERQQDDWPSQLTWRKAIAEATGESVLAGDEQFQVQFDDAPDCWYFSPPKSGDMRCRLADFLLGTLRVASTRDDADVFARLANHLLQMRFAIGGALLLTTLIDCFADENRTVPWHATEAARLLCDGTLQQHYSLVDLRRILRRSLASPSHETAVAMTNVIRGSSLAETALIRELADIVTWGTLSETETLSVREAIAAGSVDTPVDPRKEPTIRMGSAPEYLRQTQGDRWPYPSEREAINQLAERYRATFEPTHMFDESARELQNRLSGLNSILQHDDCDGPTWCGDIMGWCHQAISDLRRYLVIELGRDPEEGVVTCQEWEVALNERAPWWLSRTQSAIGCLSGPPPESHRERNPSSLSWGSGDHFYQSLCFLDELLAIDGDEPFASLRVEFEETISHRWKSWPAFSRATALRVLRPWYWFRLPQLRKLLSGLMKSEEDLLVAQHGVDHLLQLRGTDSADNLELFLRRADERSDFERTVWWIGRTVGWHVMQRSGDELVDLYARVTSSPLERQASNRQFCSGLLIGASDCLSQHDELLPIDADVWIGIVDVVRTVWPWADDEAFERDYFPLFAIFSGFNRKWASDQRAMLAERLVPTLLKVITDGTLGDFSSLHLDLAQFGKSTGSGGHQDENRFLGDISDSHMLALCQASADRVLSWRQAGRRTNDLGWGAALYGHDTVDLIKAAFIAAGDRNYLRRELPPIIDKLSTAGCDQKAAEVRVYLRGIQ